MKTLLPPVATPRCPDGRPNCLSRRQLAGPTPVSHEPPSRPETAEEAHR
ncbi:MAG: hypothetical protein JWO51_282 [Rhodospirillales bacterium]|jgi:hypothetical protein|nr:hypothetical protein [Rhodospirillales bacterium]